MKNFILTAASIIIATVSAFSQSVTETRHIKSTAFQIYENYKVVISGLYSKSAYTEDNFMALFDGDAALYNDILPDNFPQQLSPPVYFAKFKASINRIYPAFSDFNMGDPVPAGNKWQIECYFTRATRFRTQKDMKYPEWFFNYSMTIEMDKSYNNTNKVYENAKIVSIEVDNPLGKFFVIENKEHIPLTTESGETLEDWDEEFQSRIFPNDKWKISDIRIPEYIYNDHIFEYSKSRFSKSQTVGHYYQLDVQRIKKNIFGIGVNYSPNSLTFGNKMSEDFKDVEMTSSTLSLSFSYGKQVYCKKKATGFMNFGLVLNRYFYGYSVTKDINYNYVDVDKDKDSCVRIINYAEFHKKINCTSVSVPVSFEYVRQLTNEAKKPIFLSLELGVFAEFPLSSDRKHILNVDRYGEYEQYFGVVFSHYYDYGNFDVGLKQNFAYGIFGGTGLWFTLNNSNLLKFNASYKHSLNAPFGYEENLVISEDNGSYNSLLYVTNEGLQNIYFGISWIRTIGGKKEIIKIKNNNNLNYFK